MNEIDKSFDQVAAIIENARAKTSYSAFKSMLNSSYHRV